MQITPHVTQATSEYECMKLLWLPSEKESTLTVLAVSRLFSETSSVHIWFKTFNVIIKTLGDRWRKRL